MAAAGLVAYGALRWSSATRVLLARLEAGRVPIVDAVYDPAELEGLPAPVQRFFRAVLTDGQPVVAAVSVGHAGSFNLSEAGVRWKAFTSEQRVVTQRPGFVWDAKISMLPGLSVRVHDACVAGQGLLRAAALGLFTLAELRGEDEFARAEMMRFLAESAWYPTALLPGQGVRWENVDGRAARATLSDGPLAVTLLFGFNPQGLIEYVRAESRSRAVGGGFQMAPWEGRFWNHARRDGMLVPLDGEVAWLLPQGRTPYWRGKIVSLSYEFAK